MFRSSNHNWHDNPAVGWLVLIVIIALVAGERTVKTIGGRVIAVILVALLVGFAFWLFPHGA